MLNACGVYGCNTENVNQIVYIIDRHQPSGRGKTTGGMAGETKLVGCDSNDSEKSASLLGSFCER